MKTFIGTSGWSYDWNKGQSLEWYLNNSELNAIELNMSFYRLPYPNMVQSWVKKGNKLAWIIKVHRSITHEKKLNEESYTSFEHFQNIFKPLEKSIHYYLLQLPPRFTNLDVLDSFIETFTSKKLCIEFRDASLFTDETMKWAEKKEVLLVSVDTPNLPHKIMSHQIVYERIHGRTDWYMHDYSREELLEIRERILHCHPEQVYVFFNNNHAMLKNAKTMYDLLH